MTVAIATNEPDSLATVGFDHHHLELVREERDHEHPDVDPGARLTAPLERDLRWFLDDPLVAGTVASDGAFGGQLERAESFGFGAIPCRRCGGKWRTRRRASDGEQYFSEWRDGTGWVPSAKHFAAASASYQRALKVYRDRMAREHRLILMGPGGDGPTNRAAAVLFEELNPGQRMVTAKQLEELFPDIPTELCRICDGCRGIGVVPRRSHKTVEVTARPTGSSVGKAGRSPDSMASIAWEPLTRYHQLERLLGAVANVFPLHRVAIASYYGPRERRRHLHHAPTGGKAPTGGFESLWPLAPTAREWLDEQPRAPLHEQLEALKARAGLKDGDEAEVRAARAPWLSAIVRESWALYGAACLTTTEAAQAVGWRASEGDA